MWAIYCWHDMWIFHQFNPVSSRSEVSTEKNDNCNNLVCFGHSSDNMYLFIIVVGRWDNSNQRVLQFIAYSVLGYRSFRCRFDVRYEKWRCGVINDFLSLPLFQVLSKLSYCVYIIHYVEIYVRISSLRNSAYFSMYQLIFTFWGTTMVTLCLSFFLCLIFEMPVPDLEKGLSQWLSRIISRIVQIRSPKICK
ncbi:hypothetical protein JTB14_024979 [Gonioctena quinquepunctata]|nr:hypothetical protein JTB14_024979 [Gonioctena quinquepunctata]